MSKKFQYPCGCSFDINPDDKGTGGMELFFNPDIEKINLECDRTWDLISDGNTKGCFQLESRLGRSIAKKLKPSNIEELSALISILRPGCLEAMREGKSVTNHYIDKKNGQETIDNFHPSLEPILRTTYGEMIYQEQAMEIAKVVAGFNLQEADLLRKAIGKKKPEEMAKIKSTFLAGAKNSGVVTIQEAEEIFGWIEKSQRYSFNKSHAVSYAVNAYLSAYTKAHFPKIFFASYLRFAKDKIDPKSEIKELVQNATEMNIDVSIPDIRNLNRLFILKNDRIYFGLTDIKGFGDSVFNKLLEIIGAKNIDVNNISWIYMLFHILPNINSASAKALIKSGALSFLKKTRNSMLFELGLVNELTKKEIEHICVNMATDNYLHFDEALAILMNKSKLTKNRLNIIQNLLFSYKQPPYILEDNPEWIADAEEEILGCSITCSKVDMYDISMTNTTCKDFKHKSFKECAIVCGEIDNISVTKTKSGKNPGSEMAFVSLSDSFGVIDSVIFFPDQYRNFRNLLFPNNVIIIKGSKSKSGDSLIVEKAYIAKS